MPWPTRPIFVQAALVSGQARVVVQSPVEEVEGGVQVVNQVTIEVEGAQKPACVAETVTRLYA